MRPAGAEVEREAQGSGAQQQENRESKEQHALPYQARATCEKPRGACFSSWKVTIS